MRTGTVRMSGSAVLRLLPALLVAGLTASSCAPRASYAQRGSLAELRVVEANELSTEQLARAVLLEMLAPGGDAKRALSLRGELEKRGDLESNPDSHWIQFARAFEDSSHGRLSDAAERYVDVVVAASRAEGSEVRLLAWLAAARAVALRHQNPELWPRVEERVRRLVHSPGGIGWRARSQLAQWRLDEQARVGDEPVDPRDHDLGCVTELRLAGPFSEGAAPHLMRSFPAEAPGAWPLRWPADAVTGTIPEVVPSVTHGCEVVGERETVPGVHYVETYLDLDQEESLIVAVQGALAVFVDDREVLRRDPRKWGVWAKFGVHLRLGAGRHRLLARLSEPSTLVRVLRENGTPLNVRAGTDYSSGYALIRPKVLEDPNDLVRYLGIESREAKPMGPILRYIVARLAQMDGDSDVAAVVAEPLVEPVERAAGPLLAKVAEWVSTDPVMNREGARDRARELHRRAVELDPNLWRSALSLALSDASAKGLEETVLPLKRLVRRFDQVPLFGRTLGTIYGRLGWQPERERLALAELERHPHQLGVLAAALPVLEANGAHERAERVRAKIRLLDPDTVLLLDRMVARQKYAGALKEVTRLMNRRPDRRRRLSEKLARIRVEAGQPGAVLEEIEGELRRSKKSGAAWLKRADLLWSSGQADALREGLGQATQAGAGTGAIARAMDLVEAQTDFAPYRIDGQEVVRTYQAQGQHQDASAARVLDYAAVWLHSDGSSRMLEHEIVRLQSAEAIGKFAEQRELAGLVLQMRVIKRDGRTLEPIRVAGKPTVTFPHLEVGDFIETESLQSFPAQENGRHYPGLRWFFREENVAYARSEFLLIAPSHQELDIELTGAVPDPDVQEDGLFVTRRWQVSDSPAATIEPLSPPVSEFLPSVRVGYGHGLERRLRRMSEQVQSMVPIDPRVRRIALGIVERISATNRLGRARRAYRWVQDNVKKGDSKDGRQAIVGRQGNRWQALSELLRALGISVKTGVVRNRLAAEGLGPMSDPETYGVPLLWVDTGGEGTWLTIQEKFAPFGYVPAEARGMPGYVLSLDEPTPVFVPSGNGEDRLEYEADVVLDLQGDAKIRMRQRFIGKYAVRMRAGLERVAELQLRDVVESRLLGRALPGARLVEFSIEGLEDLEVPLVIEMTATQAGFAEVRAGQLVIDPPLMPRLSKLATLPERTTPVLIREAMHQSAKVIISLPAGATGVSTRQGVLNKLGHRVVTKDRMEGLNLLLDREVSIVAGRVAVADYAEFQHFAQSSEGLLARPIVVELRAGLGR